MHSKLFFYLIVLFYHWCVFVYSTPSIDTRWNYEISNWMLSIYLPFGILNAIIASVNNCWRNWQRLPPKTRWVIDNHKIIIDKPRIISRMLLPMAVCLFSCSYIPQRYGVIVLNKLKVNYVSMASKFTMVRCEIPTIRVVTVFDSVSGYLTTIAKFKS